MLHIQDSSTHDGLDTWSGIEGLISMLAHCARSRRGCTLEWTREEGITDEYGRDDVEDEEG